MEETLAGWAAGLVEETRRERAKVALAERKVLSDRRLLAKALPRMWEELAGEVEARIAALRAAAGSDVRLRLDQDKRRKRIALVGTATGRELYVFRLQPDCFGVETPVCRYRLRVVGVCDVVWEAERSMGTVTAETLAACAVASAFRDA